MTAHGTVAEISRREGRGSFLLWFGALAPPTAWALQLVVNYSLEEWFACAPSTQEPGQVLGFTVDTIAFVVTTALVLLSLAGLAVALRCLRRLRGQTTESGRRSHWMALAGVLNGILYTIIIIASYGVPAILETCRTTP